MTCSVVKTQRGVPVSELRDGHLAEVIEWPDQPNRIGQVLQQGRGTYIVVLGEPSDSDFIKEADTESCRVRVLQSGDTIRID